MNQFLRWFSMGGYSIYIWPAYALVCILVLVNVLGLKFHRRRARKKIQEWFRKQQA